ncbi:MAG: TRIC cation channel family protein [Clostridia bacterium]|nr:TRIC cation channel family protein [Clostridia bacterium]
MEEIILTVIQTVGFIVFSAAGTSIAIHKRTDIIGTIILAVVTCFGGGLIRDLTLGYIPPHLFTDTSFKHYALLVVFVSFILYHLAFSLDIDRFFGHKVTAFIIDICDSLGMAVFCIAGVNAAFEIKSFEMNAFLCIFCGAITGTGGGILRDVMMAEVPRSFKKHIYLIPAILGSAAYWVLSRFTAIGRIPSTLIAITLIMVLRVLAIIFKWNLPIPGGKSSDKSFQ